jgi:uncharacterized protein
MDVFGEVCRAMTEASFYPHAVDRVERRETHISLVFLAGDWAYKLKKPVDFGFLDFRHLQARQKYCAREVELNQRLSRGVYAEVVPISRLPSGALFLGNGEVVEVAVKMRRLPDRQSLRALLTRGAVGEGELRKIGERLARFYAESKRSGEIDQFGNGAVIGFNMEENFNQVEPFVDGLAVREQWDFIREVSRAFFNHHRELFDKRVREGRICDGHGDLRAEHIYFSEGIQIIDCIEFNDRFRYGDAASDLAYLHMDLEFLAFPHLSGAFLAAYAEQSKDYGIYSVLDFYATYRAVVKAKVDCLRSAEVTDIEERQALQDRTRIYLQLAYHYAIRFGRPTLWIVCGLPATGKSTLAEQLAGVLGLKLLQSDRVRREEPFRHGGRGSAEPYGEGLYRTAMRQRVYSHLLASAQDELKAGRSVMLDATFSLTKWRAEAHQLAQDVDCSLLFLECVSSRESIHARLARRQATSSMSDARWEHFPAMLESFEPLVEVADSRHVVVATDRFPHQALGHALAEGYARRRDQVERLLL